MKLPPPNVNDGIHMYCVLDLDKLKHKVVTPLRDIAGIVPPYSVPLFDVPSAPLFMIDEPAVQSLNVYHNTNV